MSKKTMIGIVTIAVIIIGVFVFLNLKTESTKLTREETPEVRPFIFVINSWEPHAYLDENGIAQGIVVDVVDRIFSRLNISYEVNVIPWPRALKELETGEADAALGASYSPERVEFLYYTEEEQSHVEGSAPPSFVTFSDTVFFARDRIKDAVVFNTSKELVERGYKVGANAGWFATGKLYETGIDPENVMEYFSIEEGFQALADGVVDLSIQEKLVGLEILKKMGFDSEISSLPQSFLRSYQYVPFSKQSDYPNILELRKKVLDELRKIHESGEYDEIYGRYTE